MEAKRTELSDHIAKINAALKEACQISESQRLVTEESDQGVLVIRMLETPFCRPVLTDLGSRELALRLPFPTPEHARFWIALHENWDYVGKRKIRFNNCGLRLYTGTSQQAALQILRLEWSAPEVNSDGIQAYQGKHAGHPHWHIDRSALVGPEDYMRSLEVVTTPGPPQDLELENFSSAAPSPEPPTLRLDCSWLQGLHLPAQARWMERLWDGVEIPGPHQSEPKDIGQLGFWWSGALRYFVSELRKH